MMLPRTSLLGDLCRNRTARKKESRKIAVNAWNRRIFDKEKVIEELDKLTGEECTLHECGIRSERCKPCIAKKAIEIVEKGGIE